MRGKNDSQDGMFSYISPEQRVPKDHPLRPIREMVNRALSEMWPKLEGIYSRTGRPSIPPESLLKALLLQIFYSIRSERQLMEQLDYNLLFRWFVGLSMDDSVWDHSTFSKNRDRFLETNLAESFFKLILAQADEANLLSEDHFSVDGTLIEAWASMKSVRPKDQSPDEPPKGSGRNGSVDFRGQKRRNETHASTTDPEAKMFRKGTGKEAKLFYMGHALIENRHGLVVDSHLTQASGKAEREAATDMICDLKGQHRITLAADKGYDTREFIQDLRDLETTPHVAQNNTNRRSAIDGRTTRHEGYKISQRFRKRIEEVFGWVKTVGNQRKVKHRGIRKVGWNFTLTASAYNLVRMKNLLAQAERP
jgi:transposase